jgi:hypothetical protein
MLASLGTVQAIARELKETGTWSAIERSFFGFAEAEALFDDKRRFIPNGTYDAEGRRAANSLLRSSGQSG